MKIYSISNWHRFIWKKQQNTKVGALPIKLGMQYFCDWKPGCFRATSLVRQMWFVSSLDCRVFL